MLRVGLDPAEPGMERSISTTSGWWRRTSVQRLGSVSGRGRHADVLGTLEQIAKPERTTA